MDIYCGYLKRNYEENICNYEELRESFCYFNISTAVKRNILPCGDQIDEMGK
jgi:hypothetical protein